MYHYDTFIEIGDSHKVCEDYIIQGNSPIPYIILADGCSSSEDTEMGARILCHLAKQYLSLYVDTINGIDYKKMGSWIIHNAETVSRHLGLRKSCLDATLIVALNLGYAFRVYVYGDGVIFTENKHETHNNDITMNEVSFTQNAPYYLSYLIDSYKDEQYHNLKTEKHITTIVDCANTRAEFTDVEAYDHETVFTFLKEEISKVIVCSDGIKSFLYDQTPVHPGDFINDMVAFKNMKGKFLKRRLNKLMKELNNSGVLHYDDLSIGAFIEE